VIRALVVANHFPPIGGVGVQRTLQFLRSAREFGVEPVVLARPSDSTDRWAPHDPTRLDEVGDIPVIRMPGPSPPPSQGVRRRLERVSGVPSAFTRWWQESIVRTGTSEARDIDVILAEVAPYETAAAVEKLARALRVPWVADLQDPWALDEMRLYPSFVHLRLDRRRMRSTLRTADAVVMNTSEAAAQLVEAFPEFRSHRVVAITNAFDPADFSGPSPPRDETRFRIVHAGSLHTEFALEHRQTRVRRGLLGGMPVPGVDFLTRSHVFLMQAVDQVMTVHPELRSVIEVHLVGEVTDADRTTAAPYPFVRFHGFKAHADTIAMMRSADLLFLPMQDLPDGSRARLVPAKTYEYMASGTQILAAVPEGDARDILLAIGTADVCSPAAVDCLAAAITKRVQAWQAGEPRPVPDPDVLARFAQRRLVEQLATVLTEVVDRSERTDA
jgi:glycosyl transferase family 4